METQTFASNATDSDFQEKVLLRSKEVPVLLDCWATWCGPCKTIGPILENLAKEYEGRFELVKVDIDACPQVAAALRVQSVPTIYLIKDGQPVDGCQGAQPESAIRELLDRHVTPPAFDPLKAAKVAADAGQTEDAAGFFRTILEEEPTHGEALLGMARLALSQADPSAAMGWLDKVTLDNPMYSNAEKLRGVVEFSAESGDIDALQAAVATDPKDVASWYKLGASLAVAGRNEDALEAFLKVVMLDRQFREDAGRKALLSLFEVIGMTQPSVIQTRRRLASFLF
jgi:putative thioredoxin